MEKAASPLLASQVESWQRDVNRNIAGRNVLRVLSCIGSAVNTASGGRVKELLLDRSMPFDTATASRSQDEAGQRF